MVSFNRLPKLITTDFYLQFISKVSNFIFNEKTLVKNFEEVQNLIFFFFLIVFDNVEIFNNFVPIEQIDLIDVR